MGERIKAGGTGRARSAPAGQVLKIALHALGRNKLRSMLTMLGIIIGIAAVIATVGIGEGAAESSRKKMDSLGANLLVLIAGSASRGGVSVKAGQVKTFTAEDVRAIRLECPAVAQIAAGVDAADQAIYGNSNWYTNISGTEPEILQIRNWELVSGTNMTREDVDKAANVAVLGETVRKKLFGSLDPVGREIRIGVLPFRVIGLLEVKGASPASGRDQDNQILVPYTTVQRKMLGWTWLSSADISAISRDATGEAADEIAALLRSRHKIGPKDMDDFGVRNVSELADATAAQARLFTRLVGAVALISLVVGGIGVMNIMLVSVTERTHEIGLRRALGATRSDVQGQFLAEAIVLSLIGGVIGTLAGIGASLAMTSVVGWPVMISGAAIAAAAGFSFVIGCVFGLYPAMKAARLHPVEALRYE